MERLPNHPAPVPTRASPTTPTIASFRPRGRQGRFRFRREPWHGPPRWRSMTRLGMPISSPEEASSTESARPRPILAAHRRVRPRRRAYPPKRNRWSKPVCRSSRRSRASTTPLSSKTAPGPRPRPRTTKPSRRTTQAGRSALPGAWRTARDLLRPEGRRKTAWILRASPWVRRARTRDRLPTGASWTKRRGPASIRPGSRRAKPSQRAGPSTVPSRRARLRPGGRKDHDPMTHPRLAR